ncbi:MAG: hypothetical protein ACK55I_03490, partial [bacterium]
MLRRQPVERPQDVRRVWHAGRAIRSHDLLEEHDGGELRGLPDAEQVVLHAPPLVDDREHQIHPGLAVRRVLSEVRVGQDRDRLSPRPPKLEAKLFDPTVQLQQREQVALVEHPGGGGEDVVERGRLKRTGRELEQRVQARVRVAHDPIERECEDGHRERIRRRWRLYQRADVTRLSPARGIHESRRSSRSGGSCGGSG